MSHPSEPGAGASTPEERARAILLAWNDTPQGVNFVLAVADAIRAAEREAALAMRERCAEECLRRRRTTGTRWADGEGFVNDDPVDDTCWRCAAAVRNLEVPGQARGASL